MWYLIVGLTCFLVGGVAGAIWMAIVMEGAIDGDGDEETSGNR